MDGEWCLRFSNLYISAYILKAWDLKEISKLFSIHMRGPDPKLVIIHLLIPAWSVFSDIQFETIQR